MTSSSICAVTNDRISSFFMAEWYSSVYRDHIFVLHWWTQAWFISYYGQQCCNKHGSADVSSILVLFPLVIYPVEGLLDHVVVLVLICWGTYVQFPTTVYVPTSSVLRFLFLHIFVSGYFLFLFLYSHYNRNFIVVLICISLMISDVGHLCVFWEMFIQVICSFLNSFLFPLLLNWVPYIYWL